MINKKDLIDLFRYALAAHPNEDAAYHDVLYISDEAEKAGFSVRQVAEAYEVAWAGGPHDCERW